MNRVTLVFYQSIAYMNENDWLVKKGVFMQLGITSLIKSQLSSLSNQRAGLLIHDASVDEKNRPTLDLLHEKIGDQITAIFGPEHGITGVAQDMETVNHSQHPDLGIPIFSLYGESLDTLQPTKEMIDLIDVMIVDLQDIGSRYYTYVWTACMCLTVLAKYNKQMIVCDRPNPINGCIQEGCGIDAGFESFVGYYSIPNRHGLTIAEILSYYAAMHNLSHALTVIPMHGWTRDMDYSDTGLTWRNPSPNMRSLNAAYVYPGMCLLEATNMSEGRGTDHPFIKIGAPYVNSQEFIDALQAWTIPGIEFQAISFTPCFQKWEGHQCHGIAFNVTDARTLPSYKLGLILVYELHRLYQHKGFSWRDQPYEFIQDIPAIDLLTGSERFRDNINHMTAAHLDSLMQPSHPYLSKIASHHFYL